MDIDTIKQNLSGYFINRVDLNGEIRERLCKKIDGNEYEVLRAVETPNGLMSSSDLLLQQINNQILDPSVSVCSLTEVLPVINGTIFELYNMREKKIEKHISWCNCVESEENELSDGKYVIKFKKGKKINYAVVDGSKLIDIDGDLLDTNIKLNAVQIRYPKLLKVAISDDLNNQYEEAYLQEAKKYNAI